MEIVDGVASAIERHARHTTILCIESKVTLSPTVVQPMISAIISGGTRRRGPFASFIKDLQTKMQSRRASAVFLVVLGSF